MSARVNDVSPTAICGRAGLGRRRYAEGCAWMRRKKVQGQAGTGFPLHRQQFSRGCCAKPSEPPVARREAAVTTVTTTWANRRSQAFGDRRAKSGESAHTSGLGDVTAAKGQGSIPKPRPGLALLPLAGQSPSERRGNPGTARCSRRGATEKLRRRTAPSGTRRSQEQRAGPTRVPEGQARSERRWDAGESRGRRPFPAHQIPLQTLLETAPKKRPCSPGPRAHPRTWEPAEDPEGTAASLLWPSERGRR